MKQDQEPNDQTVTGWSQAQAAEDAVRIRVRSHQEIWEDLKREAKKCQGIWGMGFPVISVHLLVKYWKEATNHDCKE